MHRQHPSLSLSRTCTYDVSRSLLPVASFFPFAGESQCFRQRHSSPYKQIPTTHTPNDLLTHNPLCLSQLITPPASTAAFDTEYTAEPYRGLSRGDSFSPTPNKKKRASTLHYTRQATTWKPCLTSATTVSIVICPNHAKTISFNVRFVTLLAITISSAIVGSFAEIRTTPTMRSATIATSGTCRTHVPSQNTIAQCASTLVIWSGSVQSRPMIVSSICATSAASSQNCRSPRTTSLPSPQRLTQFHNVSCLVQIHNKHG